MAVWVGPKTGFDSLQSPSQYPAPPTTLAQNRTSWAVRPLELFDAKHGAERRRSMPGPSSSLFRCLLAVDGALLAHGSKDDDVWQR
jgi:hypothetical protein